MKIKDNYDEQLAIIQGDNINISSTNDAKDFFILVSGIIGIILIILFSFDFIAAFFIDRMPVETQLKIESLFSYKFHAEYKNGKYEKQIYKLNQIKKEIIKRDKNIQNKSSFPITVINNKNINAMVAPDGSIFFTSALLDENLSEQELAFVLAHEMGHYSHKDHLKSISKQISIILVCTFMGQVSQANSIIQGVTEADFLNHSRKQEKAADLYAGNMLIQLYGTNNGGKTFIKRLKDNEKSPEFIYYFTTHPSWNARLKLMESQQ